MNPTETPPPDSLPQPGPDLPAPKMSFMARIRNYFLTGLVITGPVAITIWLTWSFVTWVDNLVRPLLPARYWPENILPFGVPGYGLVVALLALTLLGFLTANLVGRTLVDIGETILGRMPIVRAIYRSLKQVFETLFADSGSSFRKVGLVEFPAPGMWSIVLYSQPPGPDVASRLPGKDDYVSVFLPCSPNPTTGFFFYVARKALIELDINAEQAATLVMSAGMIQPGGNGEGRKMAALADMARAAKEARAASEKETAKAS